MDVNNCRAVAGDRPRSRLSSIAASKPLEAALAMCSLYLSLVSMITPRILTWSLGSMVCPLMVKGSLSNLYALGVKCMIAVLSASKVALLLLSQLSVSLIITSMPCRLLYAVGPVTHALKSSTNAIAPPWLSICHCTRSALKNRNKIGERGEPCGNPACRRLRISDTSPLIRMVAVRSE